MNYADMAMTMSKRAGRAMANRDCAMQAARSSATARDYRASFVQIARMSNRNALRYMRLARNYIVMAGGVL